MLSLLARRDLFLLSKCVNNRGGPFIIGRFGAGCGGLFRVYELTSSTGSSTSCGADTGQGNPVQQAAKDISGSCETARAV